MLAAQVESVVWTLNGHYFSSVVVLGWFVRSLFSMSAAWRLIDSLFFSLLVVVVGWFVRNLFSMSAA